MPRRQPVPDPFDPTLSPSQSTDPDDPPEGTPKAPNSLLFDLTTNPPPRALPPSSLSHDGPESPSPSDEFGSPPHWTDEPDPQPVRKITSAAGKKNKLKPHLRRVVDTISTHVHSFATAPETPEREYGLWLADKDDQKAIADPLASILSRRVPSGVGNPDVTDGLDLLLGLADYFAKNLKIRAAFARPKFVTVPGEVVDSSGLSDDEIPAP